jgi:hypothetical protein
MAKERKKKMQSTAKFERLNVDFKTEEEQALLAHMKSQAALNRVRLREYVISIFRRTIGEREGARPTEKKK